MAEGKSLLLARGEEGPVPAQLWAPVCHVGLLLMVEPLQLPTRALPAGNPMEQPGNMPTGINRGQTWEKLGAQGSLLRGDTRLHV